MNTQKLAAPATPAMKRSGTVTVACKIPMGLELQLQRRETWIEETPTGGRDRVRYVKYGPVVFVSGNAVANGQTPANYVRPTLLGGYALTRNVDVEFWDKWLAQNGDTDLVKNGLIFAHSRNTDVAAEAKEKRDIRSGLEPLKPDDDPRVPRPINARVQQVETADEFAGSFDEAAAG